MPVSKLFIKQAKSKKKTERVLENADDYLEAGVEHEDSAGKWRAGDAVKSLRFFNRAIEIYDQGLRKYPRSLDLAYNKARVLLETATHPSLVKHLEAPLQSILEQALNAHRYALEIDPDNTDTLFNSATVLTTIAEELSKEPGRTGDVVRLLEEALEMQSKCLSIQEFKFEESEVQRQAIESQDPSTLAPPADTAAAPPPPLEQSTSTPTAEEEEQWFSVVDPTTPEDLIDTILAQLGTLATLSSVISSLAPSSPPPASPSLSWIGSFPEPLLNTKLPLYAANSPPEKLQEIALAKANFVSRLIEAGFRHGQVDAETYKRERDAVFSVDELQLSSSGDALVANAESLIAYAAALAERSSSSSSSSPEDSTSAPQRWNALATAITHLTSASKPPISESLSSDLIIKTHLLRADASLLQHRLSLPPTPYPSAQKNATQLLKNAEVFYRNASRLSEREGDVEGRDVAGLRGGVVGVLLQDQGQESGDGGKIGQMVEFVKRAAVSGRGEAWVEEQVGEMREEGLLGPEWEF